MTVRVHAFVMAGGVGSRLHPLTMGLCKPALPFGASHRVVDFVLGNLWNSGLRQVDLLVQYAPQALAAHVRRVWNTPGAAPSFATLLPPSPLLGSAGYRGTADAVLQNLSRLRASSADLVAVFGADHVYRMDVRRMIDFHLRESADVSCATLPVPLAEATSFGIAETDARHRIAAFHEKPELPAADPRNPGHALASMGNYVFSADVLRAALQAAAAAGETDFGQHVLPRLLGTHRVLAYDFRSHRVPGLRDHEDPGYWRDVGTLDAYFDAHMDTLGPAPRFAIGNPAWPVTPHATAGDGGPATLIDSHAHRSAFAAGVCIDGAWLDHTVAGRGVRIQRRARLQRCVLADGVRIGSGARLVNAIVDRDNAVPAGEVIGHDLARDRQRFPVTARGVVVVPRGTFAAAPRMPASPAAAAAVHP